MRDRTPEKKPVFDAVNDAVSALSALVRSLRQTARDARDEAKRHARHLKVQARGTFAKAKRSAGRVKPTLTTRLGKVWDAMSRDEGRPGEAPPYGRTGPSRRRVAVKA